MRRSKDTIRGFVLGVVITALIAAAPTAMATVGKKTIDVVYSDIRIVVDGKEVTPRNAGGQVVEPFSYEGTTYLPVRAAVDAITGGNKSVDWDQDTHTIYIGGKPAQEIVDMSTMQTYPNKGIGFQAGDKQFEVRQQTITPFNYLRIGIESAQYLLGGNYATFQCTIALPDSAPGTNHKVVFKDADSKTELKRVDVNRGDTPVEVSLDVAGVDKLLIEVTSYDGSSGSLVYNATLTPIPQA